MANNKRKTGLGRGFDALIPENFDAAILANPEEHIKKLAIADLSPNPQQPRQHFDETALNELAQSIKRHGVVQPLVVTPTDNEKFIVIAGERRWRAAKLAGLKEIPALVRSSKELEQLELALVENVQRVDLSPLEQAVSIERLHQQFSLDYVDIAKRLGKAVTTVQNIVRLLQLPDAAKQALLSGAITEGHARAILAVKDPPKKLELLELIQTHRWSVRQAEQYAVARKRGLRSKTAVQNRIQTTSPLTEKLSTSLKTPVTLRRTAKGGKLEIGFKSETQLRAIIARLLKS